MGLLRWKCLQRMSRHHLQTRQLLGAASTTPPESPRASQPGTPQRQRRLLQPQPQPQRLPQPLLQPAPQRHITLPQLGRNAKPPTPSLPPILPRTSLPHRQEGPQTQHETQHQPTPQPPLNVPPPYPYRLHTTYQEKYITPNPSTTIIRPRPCNPYKKKKTTPPPPSVTPP